MANDARDPDVLAAASLSARSRWAAHAPIAVLMQQTLDNPGLISLAAGFVDPDSLPAAASQSAAMSLLSSPERARVALQYGSSRGDNALRELLLQRLLAEDAADPEAPRAANPGSLDQVVLTAGSNQLLALLADALLDPGDIVLCDAPTYFVFTGLVESVGARCVGVATDAEGMRVDALEQVLEAHAAAGTLQRIRAIYVVSYFDNPRGVSLARTRRAALVALAQRYSRAHRIYIIEDAAYRELRFGGADQASLRAYDAGGESVIYAGTFSKSFSPGLRVGYGVLPKALMPAISAIKANIDFGSPYLNQCILSEALRLGLYEPHVQQLRALYANKAACMLAALDEFVAPLGICSYQRPHGGLYVWLTLPAHIQTGPNSALFARARELGVLYVPGEYCFPNGPERQFSSMRLSFGVQSEERIRLGVQKLAAAIAERA
jgi:2-aminoadipate transaminase